MLRGKIEAKRLKVTAGHIVLYYAVNSVKIGIMRLFVPREDNILDSSKLKNWRLGSKTVMKD